MNYQILLNIALTLIAFLGGWILNSLKDAIKSLQQTDAELTIKLQHIEVLVVGNYVKRDELEKALDKVANAIFGKLDKIDLKLDTKADK